MIFFVFFGSFQASSANDDANVTRDFHDLNPMERHHFMMELHAQRLAKKPAINLSINGMVFEDLNGDGFMEDAEPSLAGWTVRLFQEGVEILNTTTNETGQYSFQNLTPGSYTVAEDLLLVWNQTAPGTVKYDVNLFEKDAFNLNFGNYYGTVPDFYFEHSPMSPEVMTEMAEAYKRAPVAYISPEIQEELARISGDRFSLLPLLDYNAKDRHQRLCGNCWIWTSTAYVEISRAVKHGIKERLSIQWFNSNYNGGTGESWACCGGNPEKFASFYNDDHVAVPWDNSNAEWSDMLRNCSNTTSVTADQIGTHPNCIIGSIEAQKIVTQGGDKEIAIANIKNVLRQGKPVFFGFKMPNAPAWKNFNLYWGALNEAAVWDPDLACGQEKDKNASGHAMVCVGYDDTDPNNRYWIMLNSWGNTTMRPNGTFLVNMDMKYNCEYPGWDYAFYWWTFDINFVEQEWSRLYLRTGHENCRAVQQTSDDGYILAGQSYGDGSYDAYLVKTDKNGNEQWNKTFGGTDDDFCTSVQQTSDGGYILAGAKRSYGAGSYDFWLIKTYKDGSRQWDKTFGGTGSELCYAVQQTSDGGYILAGGAFGAGADFWLVKTDKDGNRQWDQTFGGPDLDDCDDVQETSDGGYILAGYTYSYGAGDYDFYLVKTNKDGNMQWDKTFGGPDFEHCTSVQQTFDGGYVLAGYTYSYGLLDDADFFLVKTDKDGTKQWDKTFGLILDEYCWAAQQTSEGGYVLAGTINNLFLLRKVSKDGDLPNCIGLRAYGGQYVCADQNIGSKLMANRDKIGGWETFDLIDLGNGKVALLASNGKYVCADLSQGAKLIANRDKIGGWETLDLIDRGDSQIAAAHPAAELRGIH